MEKEFVPYEQALELKVLGFNELCVKEFHKCILLTNSCGEEATNSELIHLYGKEGTVIAAPLWQQAFKWFREKHEVYGEIATMDNFAPIYRAYTKDGEVNTYKVFSTYDEAQLECLKKLIDIVKDE